MTGKLKLLKRTLFRTNAVMAAFILVLGTASANAQDGTIACRKLEDQLARVDGAMDVQNLVETLKMQRIELTKVRGQAAAMNCLPRKAGKSETSFSCRPVLDAIRTMEENLGYYEKLSKPEKQVPQDRETILAALKKNNCDAGGPPVDAGDPPVDDMASKDNVVIYGQDPIETGSVIEFGDPDTVEPLQESSGSISHIRVNIPESVVSSDIRGTDGSYITMCVRTCDGYYFPISYRSGIPNFGNDSDLCRSRCPNTDVELYYYSVPGQDTRNMTSLSGKKYMDQPFALKYRSGKPGANPSCSCRTAGDYSVIGGLGSDNEFTVQHASTSSGATAPRQDAKRQKADDFAAKVRAALNGASDGTGKALVTADSGRGNTGSGKIRVVGPRFFPDPKEAAILRSPGPSSAR